MFKHAMTVTAMATGDDWRARRAPSSDVLGSSRGDDSGGSPLHRARRRRRSHVRSRAGCASSPADARPSRSPRRRSAPPATPTGVKSAPSCRASRAPRRSPPPTAPRRRRRATRPGRSSSPARSSVRRGPATRCSCSSTSRIPTRSRIASSRRSIRRRSRPAAKVAARVSLSPEDGFRAGHTYRIRIVQLINGKEIVLGRERRRAPVDFNCKRAPACQASAVDLTSASVGAEKCYISLSTDENKGP